MININIIADKCWRKIN